MGEEFFWCCGHNKTTKRRSCVRMAVRRAGNSNTPPHLHPQATMSDDDAVMEEEVQERHNVGRGIKSTKPDSLPWVEKYRPKDFSELIAHGDIISTCMSQSIYSFTTPTQSHFTHTRSLTHFTRLTHYYQ